MSKISATPASLTPSSGVERLYESYWIPLCRYVRRTFGPGPPEPEDVAQSAFARLMTLERVQDLESPWAFLHTTARNIVVDYHRHARRGGALDAKLTETPENNLSDLTPEDVLLQEERFEILARALEAMPLKQRRLLLLNRFEGLSYGEIGQRFGMSAESVRKQVERTINECMRALESAQRLRLKARRSLLGAKLP